MDINIKKLERQFIHEWLWINCWLF